MLRLRAAGRHTRRGGHAGCGTGGTAVDHTDVPHLPDLVERVLELVDGVPAGRVTSYGRVAAAVGAPGPRQVGAVMARHGELTCWWRLVDAGGRLPAALARRAEPHWQAELTPLIPGSVPRIRMKAAVWEPSSRA